MKKNKGRLIPCLLAVLLGVVVFARPACAEQGLFGSTEIRNTKTAAFKKWNGMLERYARNGLGENPAFPCRIGASLRCRTEEWKDFIKSQVGKSPRDQIDAVNRYANQSPYVTDLVNWGVRDYWETVGEFIARDGDCEDYAIAKYFALKALGFDARKMRIVVLEDENLHAPHAVLAVYLDGEALILDNQIPEVARDTSIVHYRPIYSINEYAWWFHRMPGNISH